MVSISRWGPWNPTFTGHSCSGWASMKETSHRKKISRSGSVSPVGSAEIFRTKTRQEWVDTFRGTDACVTPVLSLGDAPSHPHNRERATFVDVGGVVEPAPAPRFRAPLPLPHPHRPVPVSMPPTLLFSGASPPRRSSSWSPAAFSTDPSTLRRGHDACCFDVSDPNISPGGLAMGYSQAAPAGTVGSTGQDRRHGPSRFPSHVTPAPA